MSALIARVRFKRRKWYLQPLDPRSAEKIYEMNVGHTRIDPTEAVGLPKKFEKDSHGLVETSWKMIESLTDEMSAGALDLPVTDFGLNFYVYSKEWGDDKPRYRFASTVKIRRENAVQYNTERPTAGSEVKLKKVPLKQKEPLRLTLNGKEQPLPEQHTPPALEAPRYNRDSLYRISTGHDLAIQILVSELIKADEPKEPIPMKWLGPDGDELVWGVSASIVLNMKAHPDRKILRFNVWKQNNDGGYNKLERYPCAACK
ncbi:MAG: hypothetical protein WCT49_00480 [Candidatus Paceibacterota bacterium]|jgi:hypothetical protein|nr:hypothetical protein [Candidatus Paceibacterota bacterium]